MDLDNFTENIDNKSTIPGNSLPNTGESKPKPEYKSLDDFYNKTQNIGSIERALGNTLYGLNHQSVRPVVPDNRESFGYVFFTRPQLNLSNVNLRNNRKFYSLLTTDPITAHGYCRNILDPRLARDDKYKHVKSPLVDDFNPFIPLFTNTITKLSGFPDVVLPTYTSQSGLRREAWSMGDGNTDIYEVYDIDCTFRNIKDEPLMLIMQTWVDYIALVYDGTFSPYMDMITENEIDYNTRIYRLVMDESKRYVKKIGATGASYPINVPTGKAFDYDSEQKYNLQAKELNYRFKSHGFIPNDDILLLEFNQTVAIFNPGMRNMMKGLPHNMAKIPHDLIDLFNHRGIPYINTKTLELEWWISKNSHAYKQIEKLSKGN